MSAPAPDRTAAAVALVVGVNVVVGTVGLFVVFVLVYGFAESVTPLMHAAFLVGLAVHCAACTAIGAVLARALTSSWRTALLVAAGTSVVCHAVALAVGVVVSLMHEADGSVTADQPDVPFLVLVAGCLLAAALGGEVVRRWGR